MCLFSSELTSLTQHLPYLLLFDYQVTETRRHTCRFICISFNCHLIFVKSVKHVSSSPVKSSFTFISIQYMQCLAQGCLSSVTLTQWLRLVCILKWTCVISHRYRKWRWFCGSTSRVGVSPTSPLTKLSARHHKIKPESLHRHTKSRKQYKVLRILYLTPPPLHIQTSWNYRGEAGVRPVTQPLY